jgi:hypothetical protein
MISNLIVHDRIIDETLNGTLKNIHDSWNKLKGVFYKHGYIESTLETYNLVNKEVGGCSNEDLRRYIDSVGDEKIDYTMYPIIKKLFSVNRISVFKFNYIGMYSINKIFFKQVPKEMIQFDRMLVDIQVDAISFEELLIAMEVAMVYESNLDSLNIINGEYNVFSSVCEFNNKQKNDVQTIQDVFVGYVNRLKDKVGELDSCGLNEKALCVKNTQVGKINELSTRTYEKQKLMLELNYN